MPAAQFGGELEQLAAALERERERSAFLARVGASLLAASLDYEAALSSAADLAVPQLGDLCLIDLLAPDGSLRRLAVAYAEPQLAALAGALKERPPTRGSAHPLMAVLAQGAPQLIPAVPDALLEAIAAEGKDLELLRRWVRSYMCVPLVARGHTLGAISLAAAEAGRYGEAELDLAEELARRAALALDNARLYALQRDIAHTLQQSLLPPRLPEIAGLDLAARYLPGGEGNEVGGDFYDLFRLRRAWGVVIGDVCGRGPAAAALTALARHTLRAEAAYHERPSRVLSQLNRTLFVRPSEPRLLTAIYLTLRPARRRVEITLSSAGHPPPLVLRADGTVESVSRPGTLVGAFAEVDLQDDALRLRSGDALLLYTDGIVEARRGSMFFGPARLEALLAGCAGLSAAAIVERLERGMVDFLGEPAQDDVALLVLRALR